jgi:ribA/ribD-fused uncharacterized protein
MNNVNLSKYFVQFGYVPSSPFIAFYGDEGQDLFGNFWKSNFLCTFGDCSSFSVETLFQAAKFPQLSYKFNQLSADDAFKLSKQLELTNPVVNNWHKNKFNVMRDLLKVKFSCSEYKAVLLATGNKYLVEHNIIIGRDKIWSDNCDGTGENRLGMLLMELRKDYGGVGIISPPQEYWQWIKNQKMCEICHKRLAKKGFDRCRKNCAG